MSKAQIGDYNICFPISHNNTSDVYYAQHRLAPVPVAIKIIPKKINIEDEEKSVFLSDLSQQNQEGVVFPMKKGDQRSHNRIQKNNNIYRKQTESENLNFLRREIELMKVLDHPNIVSLFEVIEDSEKVALVMEYADNGSLSAFLVHGRPMPEPQIRNYFSQICNALFYLHDEVKICHRDIKADNILLDSNFNIKLSDFGLSRSIEEHHHNFSYYNFYSSTTKTSNNSGNKCNNNCNNNDSNSNTTSNGCCGGLKSARRRNSICNVPCPSLVPENNPTPIRTTESEPLDVAIASCSNNNKQKNSYYNNNSNNNGNGGGGANFLMTTQCGSPFYISPEIIQMMPYDESTDIWSLGVLLFLMATGRFPFSDENNNIPNLLNKIVKAPVEIPDFLSPDLADLIQKMLTKNPANRIQLSDIMLHRFLGSPIPKKSISLPMLNAQMYQQNSPFHLFSSNSNVNGIQNNDMIQQIDPNSLGLIFYEMESLGLCSEEINNMIKENDPKMRVLMAIIGKKVEERQRRQAAIAGKKKRIPMMGKGLQITGTSQLPTFKKSDLASQPLMKRNKVPIVKCLLPTS